MSKAISPKQVAAYKAESFPDYVFDAFNELIAANFSNGYANVKQKNVIDLMIEKSGSAILERGDIFKFGYLNVEEVYEAAGWKVEYDKPAYSESYDASFTFRKK